MVGGLLGCYWAVLGLLLGCYWEISENIGNIREDIL
jgi:hypothetical protein